MSDLTVRFWGTRGSIPTPGRHTEKYGGNTPCVELRHGDTLVVLDAGSGIRQLGAAWMQETRSCFTSIFLAAASGSPPPSWSTPSSKPTACWWLPKAHPYHFDNLTDPGSQ
jgi:hypothetical protein